MRIESSAHRAAVACLSAALSTGAALAQEWKPARNVDIVVASGEIGRAHV